MKRNKIDVLIVTGMHRSGTSCLTEMLCAQGFDIGPTNQLMEASEFNEHGYFENKQIVSINNDILVFNIEKHHSQNFREIFSDKEIVDNAWQYASSLKNDAPLPRRITEQIQNLVSDYEKENKLLVLMKDPRFCLTLNYWRPFINIVGIIISLRDPFAIEYSLGVRNKLSPSISYYLWMRHLYLLSLKKIGIPYQIICYEDLLTNFSSECRRLNLFFEQQLIPLSINQNENETIEKKLNHYKNTGSVVNSLYELLRNTRILDKSNWEWFNVDIKNYADASFEREIILNNQLERLIKQYKYTLDRINNHIVFGKLLKVFRWIKNDKTFGQSE